MLMMMKTKESEGLRPDWIYKRGDVYWADLNPFFGLVLQNDAGNFFSPTLIVAPMSSQVDKRTDLPTHIVLEQVRGLDGPSLIMLEQLNNRGAGHQPHVQQTHPGQRFPEGGVPLDPAHEHHGASRTSSRSTAGT